MRLDAAALAAALGSLGWAFFKVGLVFFGGGFLLVPVIHRDIVVHLGWLTQQEFVNGVAISQLTPGPVAVLATFCGYKVSGAFGAVVATGAVMLPAFLLMLGLSRSYQKLGEVRSVRSVLNALIPAIVGLLLAAAIEIGGPALRSIPNVTMVAIAFVLMIRWKVNPALLIAVSAVLGMVLHL